MSDLSIDLFNKVETSSLPPLFRMLMSNDVAAERTATLKERAGVGHWMVVIGTRYLLQATFALLHGMIFSYSFWSSYTKGYLSLAKSTLGTALPMADAAASVLYLDLAVLVFPVCQTLISILKRTPLGATIHYDSGIFFHKVVGWYLVFFASVHTICHWINFALLAEKNGMGFKGFLTINFGTIPGWSGYVMLITLGLIAFTSLKRFRLANFERFYYTHHLFLVFFVVLSVHGICCMAKEDKGPNGASTCSAKYGPIWQWWVYGGLGYLLAERIKKEVFGKQKTYISKVIRHPCDVVEIQVKKNKTWMTIGQYIYLCCPEVSLWQHCLLMLTSAPEEDFLSVHIHCTNDFTSSIAASVGCDFQHQEKNEDVLASKVIGIDQMTAILDVDPRIRRPLPWVYIDGPFGGAWEDVFEYEIAVLIGAGTGVMPFASMLKSIWYRMNYPHQKSSLRKIYFFWYLTGKAQPQTAPDGVNNDIYAKQSAATGLRTPTLFGRPNWDTVFASIRNLHASPEHVGVFFSGSPLIGRQIKIISNASNEHSKDDFKFVWREENF